MEVHKLRGKILHPKLLENGDAAQHLAAINTLKVTANEFHERLKKICFSEDYLLAGATDTLAEFAALQGLDKIDKATVREGQTEDSLRDLDQLSAYADRLRNFWLTCQAWHASITEWRKLPLEKLDTGDLSDFVSDTLVRVRVAKSALPKGQAIALLNETVLQFAGLLEVFCSLQSDIKKRHWPALEIILQHPYNPAFMSLDKLSQLRE
jgi:hypothetical protein